MIKRKILVPVIIITTITIILVSQYPNLYLATGYGAKSMATAVFVAGRDPQIVKLTDLDYSIVKYTKSLVDFERKSVTTSFWGFAKQTAVYREGYGCCLTGDLVSGSLRKFSFTPSITGREGAWRIAWPDGDKILKLTQ
jgi:hypothetical protein